MIRDFTVYTEEELAGLYKDAGDDEKSAIVDETIGRYRSMINRCAAPYYLAGAERGDLLQEGYIGLYEAFEAYDPGKNDKFTPFAKMCIERAMIKAVQRYSRKKFGPLNDSVSIDEERDEDIGMQFSESKVTDPQEILLKIMEAEENLEKLRESLSKKELEVLRYLREGYEYTEIAEFMKDSPKNVDNAIQRIRKKGRKIRGE